MLDGGPIDFLTGDYLAELTLMILWKARRKDPSAGYATTFLRQMEYVLGDAKDKGVKIVTDAGGLNPAGLAEQLHGLAERLGIDVKIAYIEGDDLMDRAADLELPFEPITANAYLGSWGVVEALKRGADVVIAPRITDAVLTVAPAAYWHGWERTDWDRLASAVVAGHVIECGAQATGGNYPFLDELGDMRNPGFPIAEIADDGSSVITKHPGHRRRRQRRHGHRAAAVRDRRAAVPEPGRGRALRHDPADAGGARTASGSTACAASRRRRRPRSASTTAAATATR